MVTTPLDLGEYLGKPWEGWTLHPDGSIYAPGWRRGLTPGEILAMPYVYANLNEHRRLVREAQERATAMEGQCARAEQQARYYRGLVRLEARFGMMLTRVTE